jgi:hypothetical protein
MVKVTIVSVMMILIATSTLFAENDQSFGRGAKLVQVGIGAGVIGSSGGDRRLMIPPLTASIEYGVFNIMSLGLCAGLAGFKDAIGQRYDNVDDDWAVKYYAMMVAGKAALHPLGHHSRTIDPYIGALLGYTFINANEEKSLSVPFDVQVDRSLKDYLQWGAFAGIRYYFMPHAALFVEAGASFGFVNVGLTLKF